MGFDTPQSCRQRGGFKVLRTTAALKEAAQAQHAGYCSRLPVCWPKVALAKALRRSGGSKWTLGGFEIEPRLPGESQERPRAPQERPKSTQEHPKCAPKAPKSVPRAPQERPRSAQEAPSWTQEASKSGQVGSKKQPRHSKLPSRSLIWRLWEGLARLLVENIKN